VVTVPRLWPGETVACLATGPSLTQADVDLCRDKVRVIAVNDAHRLAPWADVLYSSDRAWWPKYNGVPTFAGRRYGVGTGVGKRNPFGKLPQITVLRNAGPDGIETSPDGLRTGRNSGYAAINLAVHFGAAKIVLLGYNLSYRNGRAHFFGNHPSGLTQTEALYPSFRKHFETMVAPLKQLGVEVINATEHTSLTCFPCRPVREALGLEVAA